MARRNNRQAQMAQAQMAQAQIAAYYAQLAAMQQYMRRAPRHPLKGRKRSVYS